MKAQTKRIALKCVQWFNYTFVTWNFKYTYKFHGAARIAFLTTKRTNYKAINQKIDRASWEDPDVLRSLRSVDHKVLKTSVRRNLFIPATYLYCIFIATDDPPPRAIFIDLPLNYNISIAILVGCRHSIAYFTFGEKSNWAKPGGGKQKMICSGGGVELKCELYFEIDLVHRLVGRVHRYKVF